MNHFRSLAVLPLLALAFSACVAQVEAEPEPSCVVGGHVGIVIQSDVKSGPRQLCCADEYENTLGGHCERITPLPVQP